MPERFTVRVSRFAVPGQRDAGAFLDDLGMLEAPGFVIGQPGGLIEVEALAEAGSFALLGEPGAGKTIALEVITGRPGCPDGAGQGLVLFVPMAEIIDAAVFRERVIDPVTVSINTNGGVTLVLDGLEECPVPGAGKALVGLLKQLLRQAGAPALQLLVGCRSADYPPGVHEVLAAAFPGFTRYELAPLRQGDVLELASSKGVSAEDFLKEVARTGAGPLASFPLTLDLLLRQYNADGGLHGTAAELYGSALLALAGEHDPDRDPALASAPASQVLAVAARLCCYLLVYGRAAFWTGPVGKMPTTDLDPGSLAAGQERQAGGPFEVTGALVDAALRSALFTSGGPDRRVPAHARFAAYLAASHLASRQLPIAQLRSLLTVPAEGGVGIIPALRETAAWLIAMQPADTVWAEDADLTVLTVHGALMGAPELRAALVERLLASPRTFLGLGWNRGWNLTHPGLGGQLTPVLTALLDPRAPQPDPDQAYLALMLARQATPADVITPVLGATARVGLGHGLRAVAARTAAMLDETAAVPVLADVLKEINQHPGHDPDDELRGIGLSVLWPRHLTADLLATSLITPQRDNMLGAYYFFRKRLPGLLSDDDIPRLLGWALQASRGRPVGPGVLGSGGLLSRDDGDLAEGLLDRAFTSQGTEAVIGPAAALAGRCLRDDRELHIPAALDDREASGALTGESRRLRRLLAAHLINDHGAGLAVYQLIWGWQPSRQAEERYSEALRRGDRAFPPSRLGLLGPADLRWALEAAAAARPGKTDTWIVVLRGIWDPDDRDAQEAAWQVRDMPLWAAFSASFIPVVLGSQAETVQRSIFDSMRPRPSGWAGAPAHTAEVLDLYQRAATDAAAFPGLVYTLHADPDDGHFTPIVGDDLASRPGVKLLPQGWEQRVREAAWHYLHQGTPPGPEILDTPDQLPLTALAGYLALSFLIRHPPHGTAQLPAGDVLARWAPSILVTTAGADSPQGPDPRSVLLSRLAETASASVPGLAGKLIGGHLATRTWPHRLESLDTLYGSELTATLTRGLDSAAAALAGLLSPGSVPSGEYGDQRFDQQLSSLRRTLTVLTEILTRHGHAPGITASQALITEAAASGASEATLQAGRAAAAGLTAGDPRRWSRLVGQLGKAPGLFREVLRDLASDPGQLTDHLSARELGELWEFLARYWPYQAGGESWSSGFVGRDEQARHWRDAVPRILARRGTADAVQVLGQLAASRPDLPWLADLTREAEELRLGQDWSPVKAEELTSLLEDSTKRLVRSSSDLVDLVYWGIGQAADTLVTTGLLLWDVCKPEKEELWRPKGEVSFGVWLADQLRMRLQQAGIVINREVRVRETTTQHGQAVDIQADAPVVAGWQPEPARCRIELKGNWHPDLMTAMRTQLANDYLVPENLRHGVYVTAWFDTDLWNDPADTRRGAAHARDRDETDAGLASQADALRDLGLDVRSAVVYIAHPTKSARTERPAKSAGRSRATARPRRPSTPG